MPKPKAVVLIGPPGCGKGTIKRRFTEIGFIPFEMSDELKKRMKKDPEFHAAADDLMARGELITDEMIVETAIPALMEMGCNRDLVISGIPRTIGQVAVLDEYLAKRGYDYYFCVFNLTEEACKNRILQDPNRTDRRDNDPDVIDARMEYYRQHIPSIERYFDLAVNEERFFWVSAADSPIEVWEKVLANIPVRASI